MKVDVTEKYFWFVFFELLCGFIASIAWMGYGSLDVSVLHNRNHDTYNVLHGVLISGGFFPLVFRSMVYTYNKDMGKGTFLTLTITTLCMYIVGSITWLIDKGDVVRGIFGIAAGAILMVDMILKALNK